MIGGRTDCLVSNLDGFNFMWNCPNCQFPCIIVNRYEVITSNLNNLKVTTHE